MRRFLFNFILIFTLCVAVFFTASRPFTTEGVEADAGLLDLTETDFSSSVYALSGQWEFYYEELYTPEDFLGGVPKENEWIDLPGPWLQLGYPALGCGTYRLTVRTEPDEPLMLYIPEIMSSSTIWADGEELFRAGQTGDSPDTSVTGVRNELLIFPSGDGTTELVVQAANYRMNGSGLFYPILIGRDTVLIHHLFWQRVMVAAALGGILMIGVYHLFLFFFRRKERIYLTFSLICLTAVLRLGMESNGLLQYFRPDGVGFVLSRVFLLLFTLHSLFICLFMLQVFSIQPGRMLRPIYLASFAVPILGVCLLPYATAVCVMFLVLIPYCISVVLALRSGKIGRDPYRMLYLGSMVTFMIYGPLTKTILEGDLYVPGIVPNLFLILSQCVMLSRDYAQARNEVERVNENLERLVEQRTAQLNQVNEQLSASQAALREMIANISHDLKTPLTVLNNYLELLGDETIAASAQERDEYLGIAYHKNLDIQRLIHNLFEVTRMEGGTTVYRLERIDARQLIVDAEQKYGDMVRDQGIHFSAKAEDGLKVNLDGTKIWNILDNLIYNALRYTPKDGSIEVRILRCEDQIQIQVEDTGSGIAPEHLPHIFERFYKVSPERGEKDGSSGLGLYIVKTVTEAMGGSIEVESTPGKGTIFRMMFPVL